MSFEMGIVAAFLAMLCWGVGDFFIQKNVRKIGNIEALALIGIIGTVGLFPFVLKELYLLGSAQNLILLLSLGVITFIAAIFDFEALRQGKLSVVEIIITLELPATILLGVLFLKDTFSITQGLLLIPAIIGISLMAIDSFSIKRPFQKVEKAVTLAVLAAITLAFVNFFTASGSKTISPIMVIWVPWLIISVISLFVIARTGKTKQFFNDISMFKWIILVMGIMDTAAWLFYALALKNNTLSIITAITESYPAIALMLGVIINKERISKHQYAGAAMALLASFLLALTV